MCAHADVASSAVAFEARDGVGVIGEEFVTTNRRSA